MKRILLAALALGIAACGSDKGNVSLSTQVARIDGTVPQATSLASGEVTITRIRVVIRRLELETSFSEDHGGDDSGHHGHELRAGPILLDLQGTDLDGAIHKAFDAVVEPGTYHEIEFKIHKLTGHEAGDDPALQEMQALGASIAVDGTFNGTPFRFVTDREAEIELEGTFVVEEGTNNVTLNLDPASWFALNGIRFVQAADGTFTLSPEFLDDILRRITGSIACHDDDDRDGDDDHGDGGHRHGH